MKLTQLQKSIRSIKRCNAWARRKCKSQIISCCLKPFLRNAPGKPIRVATQFLTAERLKNLNSIKSVRSMNNKCICRTTRSNRRTLGGEPRGRFGGVRGKQPLASSPPSANRTPNLARRLENLTAFDFQCCERPLGSTRLPPPLLRKPVRVRGSARRSADDERK